MSRRVAITSIPAGGSAATTSYLWCGTGICQARNAASAPTRAYYAEGEFVPSPSAHSEYYGSDQIGSTRRVFTGTGAAAYSYDPYGRILQSAGTVTDFNYAGMFYNADSGLYLTQHRAYDPVSGRWLSRDPAGEQADDQANLYTYVKGNPVSLQDPTGLQSEEREPRLEEEMRELERDINPNIRDGLDYTPRPSLPAQPPANACPVPAVTPVGRSGNPMSVIPGTNEPTPINGRDYTGHALDQMQGRGIYPSAVENTIQTGVSAPGNVAGRTTYYDPTNNLTAVTDAVSGRVITVRQGKP
jgi:RHS repeat-associated protein